ncbi:hypothetical protein LCGC14_1861910 [marine sediment metagenome]|uniref:Uncharacterized protein n=1 Tax=marine sediment metagenome TaxID=412755 RepID=A0A0F9ILN2_9ZZZZ
MKRVLALNAEGLIHVVEKVALTGNPIKRIENAIAVAIQ